MPKDICFLGPDAINMAFAFIRCNGWPREGEPPRSIDDFFVFLEEYLNSINLVSEDPIEDSIIQVLQWLCDQGCKVDDIQYVSSILPSYGIELLDVFVKNKIELDALELFYGAIGAYDQKPINYYQQYLRQASNYGFKWQNQKCYEWADTEEMYQFFVSEGCPLS